MFQQLRSLGYLARMGERTGSPNGSIHRTFRAVFEMPVVPFNHNVFKIGKRLYRNPICLATEWRLALDNGEYDSPAALARHFKVSRARVTQILNLLHLSPDVLEMISALGDPLRRPIAAERKLRPLLTLTPDQQIARVIIMISKNGHKAVMERTT